jgi:glycerol-3-phosphate O-acyltransferase
MSHEMSRTHQEQVAEKAAIIANTAFKLGLETEGRRILDLLNEELTLHKRGSSGAATIQKIISQVKREDTVESDS